MLGSMAGFVHDDDFCPIEVWPFTTATCEWDQRLRGKGSSPGPWLRPFDPGWYRVGRGTEWHGTVWDDKTDVETLHVVMRPGWACDVAASMMD